MLVLDRFVGRSDLLPSDRNTNLVLRFKAPLMHSNEVLGKLIRTYKEPVAVQSTRS